MAPVLVVTQLQPELAWFTSNLSRSARAADVTVLGLPNPKTTVTADYDYFLYLAAGTIVLGNPLDYFIAKWQPDEVLCDSTSQATFLFGRLTAAMVSLLNQSTSILVDLLNHIKSAGSLDLVEITASDYLVYYSLEQGLAKAAYTILQNGQARDHCNNVVTTQPSQFRPQPLVWYPPFATDYLEQAMSYHTVMVKPPKPWQHLNVWWTNLECNSSQARRDYDRPELQRYLDQLPPGHYFTLVQHDDGIKNHTLPAGTVVLAAGGKRANYSHRQICLPLIYDDANQTLAKYCQANSRPRDIFCSFVGCNTHPVRWQTIQELSQYPDVKISQSNWSTQVGAQQASNFLDITVRSVFSLCPRGYGQSSFRFYEALQLGAIPVYIWTDQEWLPFRDVIDYSQLCVSINVAELPHLYQRLKAISPDQIAAMRQYYQTIKHYFTMEGMCQQIYRVLTDLATEST